MPFGNDETRIIDGYKRDTRRRLLFGLVPGFATALVGAVLLLAGTRSVYARDPSRAFAHRPTAHVEATVRAEPAPRFEPFFLYGGALLCLASPIVMGLSLRRLLDDDDFLLLRVDGLVRQEAGRAWLFPWDALEAVRHDEATDSVVLVLRDETEVRITHRYTGASPRELARHIAEVRRKALFRLLPSQRRRAPS